MKYIKKFERHTDYEAYKNSQDYLTPNVSYCVDLNELHFEEYVRDYSKEYLTFEALEDTTYEFDRDGLFYSFDGKLWTALARYTPTPTVNAGDKIMFKGNMVIGSSGIGNFSSTSKHNVMGNVMSLLYGDDFVGQTDLTGKSSAFYRLFYNNENLVDASNLILPATTLASYCYGNMFYGCTALTSAPTLPATVLANSCYESMFRTCTSLTIAPELPATTLASYCYNRMFYECENLNYIKAMFLTTPSSTYTSYWVSGVSSTGTFVKNSEATWGVFGSDAVPMGWTIQTATE